MNRRVDYGMGNRRSAEKALEHVGAHVEVSGDSERLRMMDGLVLPGVGAFPAAMAAIFAPQDSTSCSKSA